MRKPISTAMHAALDYLTVGTFLTLPEMMGWSWPLKRAMQTLALGKLAYVLMTDHEGGVWRKMPMSAHLVADAVGGATLCALPFLTEEEDETAATTCVALGLFDILAAPLTQTTPTNRSMKQIPAAANRQVRRVGRTVARTATRVAGGPAQAEAAR